MGASCCRQADVEEGRGKLIGEDYEEGRYEVVPTQETELSRRERSAMARDAKNQGTSKVIKQKIEMASKTGVLALKEARLKSLPDEVMALTNLKVLDCGGNQLSALSNEIVAMENLKTLNVQDNKLVALPDLSELSSLTTLVVDNNQIASIEGLPSSLQHLSLANNGLTSIPESVLRVLPSLVTLNLSGNRLQEIPPQFFSSAARLDELNLDRNLLSSLPGEIKLAKSLKGLSLAHNRLEVLPFELLAESTVNRLWIPGNRFTRKEFEHMRGVDRFMDRRKETKTKGLLGGADTSYSLCGLD